MLINQSIIIDDNQCPEFQLLLENQSYDKNFKIHLLTLLRFDFIIKFTTTNQTSDVQDSN